MARNCAADLTVAANGKPADTCSPVAGYMSLDDIFSDGEGTGDDSSPEHAGSDEEDARHALDDEEEDDEEDEEDEAERHSPNTSDSDGEASTIFERSDRHVHLQRLKEPPFWYGHEDEDQAAIIFVAYAERLKLRLHNHQRVRQPKLFVGSVKRQAVANCRSPNWTTLDEVSVYTRDKVAYGMPMPFAYRRMLLTLWHKEDGVPVQQHELKAAAGQRYWLARVHGVPSFLYALPVAHDGREQEFRYRASGDDEVVSYAPINGRVSVAAYVPVEWLRSDLDADEDSLFDGGGGADAQAELDAIAAVWQKKPLGR